MINIHECAKQGKFQSLQEALAIAPDSVDRRHEKTDFTPLCYAVISEKVNCLGYLLQQGADINIQVGERALSPLMLGVLFRKENSIDSLLTAGNLKPNLIDTEGNTALMQAILFKENGIIEKLTPLTDLSITNNRGQTALTLSHDPYINDILIACKKRMSSNLNN